MKTKLFSSVVNRVNWGFSIIALSFISIFSTAQKNMGYSSAYGHGETIKYSLNYGFLSGGEGILKSRDTILNNKKVMNVVLEGKTSGFAEKIYKISDRFETFVDPSTGLPVKEIRNIREAKYRYHNEVIFNRDSSTVISQKTGVHKVPKDILDIVSALCWARQRLFNDDLKPNQMIVITTYFSDEVYPLRLRYKGIEMVETEFGNVECYRFSPVTEVGRAFKTDEDMQIWISRDKNRIPVKVKFDLTLGSFTCDMEAYSGLKYPFAALQKN